MAQRFPNPVMLIERLEGDAAHLVAVLQVFRTTREAESRREEIIEKRAGPPWPRSRDVTRKVLEIWRRVS